MDRNGNRALFAQAPVGRAVVSLVVPTVISQLITVIYNMADTFFIGQIGDPNQVAAVSLCMPMFVFLTGLANLFGIGGSSLMARSAKGKAGGFFQSLDIRRCSAAVWRGAGPFAAGAAAAGGGQRGNL